MKKTTPKLPSFILSFVLFLISFNSFSNVNRDTISSNIKNNSIIKLISQEKATSLTPYSLNTESEFTNKYIKKNYPISSSTNENLNKAIQVFKEIDKNENLTDLLEPKSLSMLPLGIKKTIGGIQYTLGISNAKFTSKYTELTAFVKIVLPQRDSLGNAKELFFGANNIKLSHKGGLVGNTSLVLLGDAPIKINGEKLLLILKNNLEKNSAS